MEGLRERSQTRQTGQQRDRDVDLVLGRDAVGVCIKRVQQQNGALERIHDRGAHRGDRELTNEFARQMTIGTEAAVEIIEFLGSRELAGDEQVSDLLVAKAALRLRIGDEVLDVVAAQDQMTLIGHDFPIDALVAMDIGNARETGNDAGPVDISQAALDVVGVEDILAVFLRGNVVIQALGRPIHATARLVVEDEAAQVIVEAIVDVMRVVGHGAPSLTSAPARGRGGLNESGAASRRWSNAHPAAHAATGGT